jgi:hypothetical protein
MPISLHRARLLKDLIAGDNTAGAGHIGDGEVGLPIKRPRWRAINRE